MLCAVTASETLVLRDLDRYLMLRNGNYLYRVPFRGGSALLKVYHGSRGPIGNLLKSFENLAFAGQTSYMPRTRRRVERECLEIWRKHGFRVYDTFDDVEVKAPGCRPGGYTLFEFRAGPKLNDHLSDAGIPELRRLETWRRFLVEWSRRHDLAIREAEPRLVHENGDGKHVLILDDGFLWFDFEMIGRSRRRVREQVSHEIIQYLWNVSKSVPQPLRAPLLEAAVDAYPRGERLRDACDSFLANPDPILRAARALDRTLRSRARKPTSKYQVARRLRSLLDRA